MSETSACSHDQVGNRNATGYLQPTTLQCLVCGAVLSEQWVHTGYKFNHKADVWERNHNPNPETCPHNVICDSIITNAGFYCVSCGTNIADKEILKGNYEYNIDHNVWVKLSALQAEPDRPYADLIHESYNPIGLTSEQAAANHIRNSYMSRLSSVKERHVYPSRLSITYLNKLPNSIVEVVLRGGRRFVRTFDIVEYAGKWVEVGGDGEVEPELPSATDESTFPSEIRERLNARQQIEELNKESDEEWVRDHTVAWTNNDGSWTHVCETGVHTTLYLSTMCAACGVRRPRLEEDEPNAHLRDS